MECLRMHMRERRARKRKVEVVIVVRHLWWRLASAAPAHLRETRARWSWRERRCETLGRTTVPTSSPTYPPTTLPTELPTTLPTTLPTALPSPLPVPRPTAFPSPIPIPAPTPAPTTLLVLLGGRYLTFVIIGVVLTVVMCCCVLAFAHSLIRHRRQAKERNATALDVPDIDAILTSRALEDARPRRRAAETSSVSSAMAK